MESGGKACSMNPYTGETVGEQNYFSKDDINNRIQRSWDAFCKWRRTSPTERKNMLNKLATILEKHMDKLAKTITLETGKVITQSRREVEKSIEFIRYYAQNTEEFLKPWDLNIQDAKKCYLRFEPLGPIFNISSYNYPLFQNIRRAIPALLMGNTVLSRSSSLTPQIGMMIEELYQEAGFDKGEFLNLISSHDQTEMIICNSKIRGVAYVGSFSGGQTVGSLAGKCSKKFITENGSNDTFIVMKDADIGSAVERAMTSRLKDAGQAAISANTFLIEESIYDSFRDKLLERLRTVKMGDPMDANVMLGPLSNKDDLEKSIDQVKRAQEKGAKLLCGGGRPKDVSMKSALFFEPTMLEVTEENPILNEETFAPIFSLMRFKDEEQIIRITNSKQFGIGTAIFTSNESKAEELASRLEVGAVFINTRTHFHKGVPIGGVKCSGIGREGGIWGTREFANVMTVFVSGDSKSIPGAKSKPLQEIISKAESGEMGVTAL